MPEAPYPEYVSIPEAVTLFNRSEKSIKREINKSLDVRKAEVLINIILRMNDGTELPGTECSPDTAELKSGEGLNPKWVIRSTWLLEKFGLKGEPIPAKNSGVKQSEPTRPNKVSPKSHPTAGKQSVGESGDIQMPPLPADPEERAVLLESLYRSSLDDLARERDRYDDILPIIKGLQQNFANAQFLGLPPEAQAAALTPFGLQTQAEHPHQATKTTRTDQTNTTKAKPESDEQSKSIKAPEVASKKVVDVSTNEPENKPSTSSKSTPTSKSPSKKSQKSPKKKTTKKPKKKGTPKAEKNWLQKNLPTIFARK